MSSRTVDPTAFLVELLAARLAAPAREWTEQAATEVAAGASSTRFGALLSLASRHVPTGPLAPSADERAGAEALAEKLGGLHSIRPGRTPHGS